jgi:AraC-like DNA-binding protein
VKTHHVIKSKFPSLKEIGIAAEYFPKHVNLKVNKHTIDVVLISFIISGKAKHLMGEEVFEENGACVGITHYGQTHTIVTDKEGVEVMNIYLDLKRHILPDIPKPLSDILPDILPMHPKLQNRLNRVVRIKFDSLEPIKGLGFSLVREFKEQAPGYHAAALSYFRLFLMECCRQAMKSGVIPSANFDSPSLARLEDVRRYIDANSEKQFALEDLSEMAGLNKNYFCRAFKKYTGATVFNYILNRRIQKAMIALRTTDEKVISIAYECGFNDLSYFNRTFKRITGKTPGAAGRLRH